MKKETRKVLEALSALHEDILFYDDHDTGEAIEIKTTQTEVYDHNINPLVEALDGTGFMIEETAGRDGLTIYIHR
jgi:hypothetical protein